MPQVESVAMGIWVGVGSRYEPRAVSGMSHFIEHLLFKGTKKRRTKDITQAIEGRGGYLNAFTQQEATCYYARVSYDRLAEAVDVLADMYLHPRFRAEEITKERAVIMEEIMMYRDLPQHTVHEMLIGSLWKGHPLGRPIAGAPETLGAMDRSDIVTFKRRKYASANTVVAFAGKVDHGACVKLIRGTLGRMTAGRAPAYRRVTPAVKQSQLALAAKDIEQAHLALAVRLFGRSDKRKYALKLLSAVLGENMSSRLFQVVREKHGLAYSIHSSVDLFKDSGALVVTAGVDRKRKERAVKLIASELVKIREHRIGKGEMGRAKDYVIGHIRLGLESTAQQMLWLGDNIVALGRFTPPEEVIEKVAAVTPEEVQAVARTVIKRSRTSFSMIAPGMSADDESGVRKALDRL